jgi:RNA-directed DNA polymerase
MTTTRPPYQWELAFPTTGPGEAVGRCGQEVEMATAAPDLESPAATTNFMERICAPDNIERARRAVVRNKGAAGIDGVTVGDLPEVLAAHWPEIEEQLLRGRYRPQPVRRVRIPKPAGGWRDLGIPTRVA